MHSRGGMTAALWRCDRTERYCRPLVDSLPLLLPEEPPLDARPVWPELPSGCTFASTRCRPTLRQRLAATDREHPLAEVMKNARCHRYFRLSNPAHNGLVGGSSPPGPPPQKNPL